MKNEVRWPLGAVFLTILLGLTGLFSGNAWIVPWALSLVLFGLPHGAVDHDVCLRLWKPQPPPRWALAAILLGYVALGLVVLAGWFLVPEVVFLSFIVLTIVHWGLADLWWSWKREPAAFPSRGHRALFALFRGALPILLPLVIAPAMFREVAEVTCRLFSHGPIDFGWIERPETKVVAVGILVASGFSEMVLSRGRTRWLNVFESLSLVAFFLVVPSIAAVGLYFALWHGLRHILRLQNWENSTWRVFAVRSLPATLGALFFLLLLYLWVRPNPENPQLLGVYLALIAALTVPHALVVTWLDRRDYLWA